MQNRENNRAVNALVFEARVLEFNFWSVQIYLFLSSHTFLSILVYTYHFVAEVRSLLLYYMKIEELR